MHSESNSLVEIITELLNRVRLATSLAEVNIAAGIAHEDLLKLEAAAI